MPRIPPDAAKANSVEVSAPVPKSMLDHNGGLVDRAAQSVPSLRNARSLMRIPELPMSVAKPVVVFMVIRPLAVLHAYKVPEGENAMSPKISCFPVLPTKVVSPVAGLMR